VCSTALDQLFRRPCCLQDGWLQHDKLDYTINNETHTVFLFIKICKLMLAFLWTENHKRNKEKEYLNLVLFILHILYWSFSPLLFRKINNYRSESLSQKKNGPTAIKFLLSWISRLRESYVVPCEMLKAVKMQMNVITNNFFVIYRYDDCFVH
jgi:hypothetical protein